MKPVSITLFEGPNVHAKRPLVRLRFEPSSLPAINTQSLARHIDERLPVGPDWQEARAAARQAMSNTGDVSAAYVLATLAGALQFEPFGRIFPTRVESNRSLGTIDVLIAFFDPDVAQEAVRLALPATRLLFAAWESERLVEARASLAEALAESRRRCKAMAYTENTIVLLEAARERGVPLRKLVRGQRFALLGHGKRRIRVAQSASDLTSAFASNVSNDKALTSRVLRRAGIPVPRQRLIEREGDVAAAIAEIGFPLVVKGQTGSKGSSVTANIRTAEDAKQALAKARRFAGKQVIEEHIEGTDYRLLVVDGKMIAAARRRAAQVVGDGRHSIAELVAMENRHRDERSGYGRWLVPLGLDADTLTMLSRAGLTSESVPEAGQEVRLRSAGNISQGGTPEDVTDRVHPDTVALAERAARTVGLDIAGVDVLTRDITRPLSETGGVILEINHHPNLRPHYACETPRDVAGAIVDYLLPAPERGRIPIAAVTGTNGKTTTCRMLSRAFTESGYCTALTTTSGTYVGKELVLKGDFANSVGARSVLQDPRVEAAVLETSRGGIIKRGIGWDTCDVAMVTNISADHIGQDNVESVEELAEIKGLIVALARSAVVLNADNAHCRAMAERASAPIWWVATEPANALIEPHLAAGGQAVLLQGAGPEGWLVHCAGAQRREILRVGDIPASLDGIARHNVENAMMATAAALAMQLPLDALRRALSGFSLSFEDSPGRLNIRDVDGARIVLDYAHNVDGIAKIRDVVAGMPADGRRICFLVTPTRQREEAVAQLAATVAPSFDRFIVSSSPRPGIARTTDEVVQGLRQGLMAAGIAPEAITVERDEGKAMEIAFQQVRPGDLLLVLPDKRFEAAWRRMQALRLAEAPSIKATVP